MNLTNIQFKFNKPRIELIVHKTASTYDSVAVSSGINKKKSFWFDGTNWNLSQYKTATNQEPTFDVIDAAGNSFGDKTVYPKSEFAGTKVFSYKRGSALDLVLGFGISYSNIGNSIADINIFYHLHKKKIALLSSKNMFQSFYDNSSKMVVKLIKRNSKRLLNELRESKELMVLLAHSTSRDLDEKEKKKIKKQLLDICKTIPSLTIFLLPGGSLLLPILIKFIPTLLPSAFNENLND